MPKRKRLAYVSLPNEIGYREWRNALPDNLKYTNDDDYDMRGAYESKMEPVLTEDGTYHLGSRNPKTGKILKSPHHPTYLMALINDARMGYYPYTDNKGNTYTNTWVGNKSAEKQPIVVPYKIDSFRYGGEKDNDMAKPKYFHITNSSGDTYRFDPNGKIYNDDGTVNAQIDNVNIYSPRGYREANERRFHNMIVHTENPKTGYAPPLKRVYPEFDVIGLSGLGKATLQAAKQGFYYGLGKPNIPKGFTKLIDKIRTKVGDVEIDDPSLYYRQGSKNMGDEFINTGVVGAGTDFDNPMFAKGRLWYGLNSATKKAAEIPVKVKGINLTKPRMEEPKTDLIVSNADMVPANAHAHKIKSVTNKELTHPYMIKDYEDASPGLISLMRDWDNAYYSGLVDNVVPVTKVSSESVRAIPEVKNGANITNSVLYRYEPGYGYRVQGKINPSTIYLRPKQRYGGRNKLADGGYVVTKRRTVYKSLSGKVFNTKEEAIKDNTDITNKRGLYADKDITYKVQKGDSLWGIANKHKTDVDTLRRLNPTLKGDLIHPNDNIIIGRQSGYSINNIRNQWKKEKKINIDNTQAIQSVKHNDNYVIIDKMNNTLSVFDKDNKLIYKTSDISTGKSGNDYNTITYVNEKGQIRSGAGNESTPAGITKITGIGVYHGFPSFQRGRPMNDGKFEDIASSLHFGSTSGKKQSNGCVRMGGKTLKDLSNYIGVNTNVYTLPEKKGSRFKVADGKLSFIADNPYGKNEGREKYWDDYNTYTDKTYSKLKIVDKTGNNDATYKHNRKQYSETLSNNKKRIMNMFNLDSDTYNRLAELALGIAEQETKYGTSTRKAIKDAIPDVLLNIARGNSNRSRGMTQIKLNGDNASMQKVYKSLGINETNINNADKAALATISRLAQMYNTEVRGRKFTGQNNSQVNAYDALLYKWLGRNSELTNHTATPKLNNYINNVKKYAQDFNMYSISNYKYGGRHRLAYSN